jgi:hypothetical protein
VVAGKLADADAWINVQASLVIDLDHRNAPDRQRCRNGHQKGPQRVGRHQGRQAVSCASGNYGKQWPSLMRPFTKDGFYVMLHHPESPISVTIDLSSDEATDLAAFLARVTPSALLPLTGLSGLPAVGMAARVAVILGRLAENLTRTKDAYT